MPSSATKSSIWKALTDFSAKQKNQKRRLLWKITMHCCCMQHNVCCIANTNQWRVFQDVLFSFRVMLLSVQFQSLQITVHYTVTNQWNVFQDVLFSFIVMLPSVQFQSLQITVQSTATGWHRGYYNRVIQTHVVRFLSIAHTHTHTLSLSLSLSLAYSATSFMIKCTIFIDTTSNTTWRWIRWRPDS